MEEALTHAQIYKYYETELRAVLQKHNPTGADSLNQLLGKFPGKERQVYVQICKKCGVEPLDPPTASDFINGRPKESVIEAASDGRVSKWLSENNYQKYALQHQFLVMTWEQFMKINTRGRLIELGVLPKHAEALLTLIGKDADKDDDIKSEPAEKPDYKIDEKCYVKILVGSDEKWVNGKVMSVNEDGTFNIHIYSAKNLETEPQASNIAKARMKKAIGYANVVVSDSPRKKPRFNAGDRVEVFGLRSQKKYNGKHGVVLLHVPRERRYQLKLDVGPVIAIKTRNVRPIPKCKILL